MHYCMSSWYLDNMFIELFIFELDLTLTLAFKIGRPPQNSANFGALVQRVTISLKQLVLSDSIICLRATTVCRSPGTSSATIKDRV